MLNLSDNQISDISLLKNLTQLTILGLQSNEITHLPAWILHRKFRIGRKPGWKKGWCSILDNPLIHPPLEVVEQGHDAIVRFFQELGKGVDYIYEVKLLLVGEGGVGKTTLRKKLKNKNALMPAKEDRTRGIEIETYSFINEEGKTITIHVWDFGGQNIYHATHRFFFTHRSFYLLMTETRRQDDNFDNWIPSIQLFAGTSPILVVKNLTDGFHRTISLVDFLKNNKFNIVDRIIDVNLKDNTGLAALKKTVHSHVQRLPQMGQALPSSWIRIREEIELLSASENVISFNRFCEVCKKYKLKEDAKINDLGHYFHDLGIVLWYKDIPVLKNKVILNPNWATDAVFRLIDDTVMQDRRGLFSFTDASRVWADKEYSHMTDEFLELMKAFRLCYQKKKRSEYIIPSLLPPDPTEDVCWDDTDNLRFHYLYEFLPKGIVNQLTAELHRYIENDGYVWARGVVFKDRVDQVRAKVEEVRKARMLQISIKGIEARGFMRLIIESLEEIHETYPGIEVIRQVPCQCAACINNKYPTIFSYEKLLEWKNQGRNTVVCNESGESLDIKRILYDIGNTPGREKGEIRQPLKLFIVYSKADLSFTETLKMWLKPLERMNSISTWYDRDMIASAEWDFEVKKHLAAADIILFMVSPDFISTDYIWDTEIPIAIERYERKETKVIPVILRPCAWEGKFSPFSKLLALPEKGKPITSYKDPDDAWLMVFHGIEKVVDCLLKPAMIDSDW